MSNGNMITTFYGHTGPVYSVKFSNDENKLISGSRDKTIKIWDLLDNVLLHDITDFDNMITNVAISYNGYFIFTTSHDCAFKIINKAERKTIVEMKNFAKAPIALGISDRYIAIGTQDALLRVYDMEALRNSFNEYLAIQACFGNENGLSSAHGEGKTRTLLSPLHIMAFMENSTGRIKKCLDLGFPFTEDKYGHSPLYYSIAIMNKDITDMLLKAFIDVKSTNKQKFLENAYALRNDFIHILNSGSLLVPDFLESLIVVQEKFFGIPKSTLPMYIFSDLKTLTKEQVTKPSDSLAEEDMIALKIAAIPVPVTAGSQNSIAFLEGLADSPNKVIFRSQFIRHYVHSKWNSIWWIIFLITLIYFANLFIMMGSIMNNGTTGWIVSLAIVNFILFVLELLEFTSNSKNYLTDFWNWVDIIRIYLTLVYIFCVLLNAEDVLFTMFKDTDYSWSFYFYYLKWLMVLTNFFRGITCFRAFSKTRFYVELIISSSTDIISFLCLFFYSTLAFGALNSVEEDNTEFSYIWMWSYNLNLGGFDTSSKFLFYFGFMLATVVNVIIMLNLLISILGDSYDKFQTQAAEIDIREMVEVLIDIEHAIIWRKDVNITQFLHIPSSDAQEDSLGDEWEGKIVRIENLIKYEFHQLNDKFRQLDEKFNKLGGDSQRDGKFLQLDDKFRQINNKLDTLLKPGPGRK